MADVTAMSVKNLKNTIASAGLDHDGIVDKEELIALARKALAVLESSEEEEVELEEEEVELDCETSEQSTVLYFLWFSFGCPPPLSVRPSPRNCLR